MRPDRQRHNPAGSWKGSWLLLACMAAAGCSGLGPSEYPVSRMVPALKQGVYTLDTVDVRPVITRQVQPDFPSALDGYLTGKATVVFTVGVDGKATDAMVVEADDGRFGAAALQAIAKWRFKPAQVKSKPVPCRMSVPFFFDSPYGADTDVLSAGPPPDKAPPGDTPSTLLVPQ